MYDGRTRDSSVELPVAVGGLPPAVCSEPPAGGGQPLLAVLDFPDQHNSTNKPELSCKARLVSRALAAAKPCLTTYCPPPPPSLLHTRSGQVRSGSTSILCTSARWRVRRQDVWP